MHTALRATLGLVPLVLCALCPAGAQAVYPAEAVVTLAPASGSSVQGEVHVRAISKGVHFEGSVTGLSAGVHGMHVHEAGDCSAPDASSAKGHFNPLRQMHGMHAGDLPDIVADASGKAKFSFDVAGIDLGTHEMGISGRALVIHADPDDHKSQPAGNSGKRIACGVIAVR